MSSINKLQLDSFGKAAKVTWHLKNCIDRHLDAQYGQTFLAQGRWMVGMKLIKATFWHYQTNGLHLDAISQMLLNVLDLPPSTCLCICVCLHSKRFLHRSLDLFASDLVLFVNAFFSIRSSSAILMFLINIPCSAAVFFPSIFFPFHYQIMRVCL